MRIAKLFPIKVLIIASCFFSCKKDDFLNTKPNQGLVVPSTIADMQALLDNEHVMNGYSAFGVVPYMGVESCDDYFVKDATYNSRYTRDLEKKIYTWDKNLYGGEEIVDWDAPYQTIFYANSALEGLDKLLIAPDQTDAYNNVKGSALFYRAHSFYQLAQIFAQTYDSSTANKELGIPLRLTSDISTLPKRATLQGTYDQIISDLREAVGLLPITPLYLTRPSRPAAYALLARVYLVSGDYLASKVYADSCLQLKSNLTDLNTLPASPFGAFSGGINSDELIFTCNINSVTNGLIYVPGSNICDSILFKSFSDSDLRKAYWIYPLSSGPTILGGYFRTYAGYFGGIAVDEIYLIRAECEARLGDVTMAMQDLNTLMKSRFKTGYFMTYSASNADDALMQVLQERRKELLLRGLRWSDLRRLNKDPRFATTIKRIVNGIAYTLPPNDPRYVFPIPQNVLSFNPNMQDNSR